MGEQGRFTLDHFVVNINEKYKKDKEPLTIQFNNKQVLVFEESKNYSVNILTNCNNNSYSKK